MSCPGFFSPFLSLMLLLLLGLVCVVFTASRKQPQRGDLVLAIIGVVVVLVVLHAFGNLYDVYSSFKAIGC